MLALGAIAAVAVARARKLSRVAPALRGPGLALMPPLDPVLVPFARFATRRMVSRTAAPPGLVVSERTVRPGGGAPEVRVLVVRRENARGDNPALVWMHGGGYLIGSPEMDLALLARILERVDATVLSVDYRLAPRDRAPAAVDDAMAVLRWAVREGAALGIDPRRIAVGGNSAGGGIAAALAQRARDEGVRLIAQLLMYPMLNDRGAAGGRDHGGRGELVWTPRANRHAWRAYLGREPGSDSVPAYAVAARCGDLSGLPPAWIGVGTLDLFHDEDVAYAARLRAAGVDCALDVVADAPHAFDLLAFGSPPARAFHDGMIATLAAACERPADPG